MSVYLNKMSGVMRVGNLHIDILTRFDVQDLVTQRALRDYFLKVISQ